MDVIAVKLVASKLPGLGYRILGDGSGSDQWHVSWPIVGVDLRPALSKHERSSTSLYEFARHSHTTAVSSDSAMVRPPRDRSSAIAAAPSSPMPVSMTPEDAPG